MHRKHHKKPAKKKNSLKNNFKLSLNILLTTLAMTAIILSGYLFLENQKLVEETLNAEKTIKELKTKQEQFKKEHEDQIAKHFEEKTNALEIEYTNQIDEQEYLDSLQPPYKEEKEEFTFIYEEPKKEEIAKEIKKPKDLFKVEAPKQKEIPKRDTKAIVKEEKKSTKESAVKIDKPKLAIIIDDVTTKYQIRKIQNIGYDVNIAFLPPTPRHPSSAKIASMVDQYMIHLPLQASSNKFDEKDTLYITDDIQRIETRIKILKDLYPKAKFINNHTGSKFTANKQAMDKLFQVLKKYDYTFIDSRTTAKSVAKKSAKKYGMRMLSRNIFLDNKKDSNYIQNQLKKAIKLAKRHGSAIAIGHPYNITFDTLKNSKHLLEDLELVYVEKL